MNRKLVQIGAVLIVLVVAGGFLYFRMGGGSDALPPEARTVIQAAHDRALAEEGSAAQVPERTAASGHSGGGERLGAPDAGGAGETLDDGLDQEKKLSSKKKSRNVRKRRPRKTEEQVPEEQTQSKKGKKASPAQTES